MGIIKTDSLVIQSSRLRESTKELLNILINYYNITHEEFMKITLDMWLENMSKGKRPEKKFPYLEKKNQILIQIRNKR